MNTLRSVDALYDFIATVVLCAPNRFPSRDYLPPDQQMNLDRAFEKLRTGIEVAYPEADYANKRQELSALLNASLVAYKSGDRATGAHLLQDFKVRIFKTAYE